MVYKKLQQIRELDASRELTKQTSSEISTSVSTITNESSSKNIIDLSALDTPQQNSTWWNDYTGDTNKPVIIEIVESMSTTTIKKGKQELKDQARK